MILHSQLADSRAVDAVTHWVSAEVVQVGECITDLTWSEGS